MAIFRHRFGGPGPAGDQWICTMHSASAQALGAVHSAFLTFLAGFLGTTVEPLWPTQTQCLSAETDQLDPVTGRNIGQELSAVNYKGTGAGAQLPQRTSAVCGLRTSLPTRAGRGRFYLPAPDATHTTTDGQLAAATATTLASGLATAIAGMNGTASVGVYHSLSKSITPVTQVTVGQVLGSQRRRTNKVPAGYSSANV